MEGISDNEESVRGRGRRHRQRNKKTKKQSSDDETATEESTISADEGNQENECEKNIENDENEQGKSEENEHSECEIEDQPAKRISARNFWLKLQLEQNNEKTEEEISEETKNTDDSEADNYNLDTQKGFEDEESNKLKKSHSIGISKNNWSRREQTESNESQDDDEFLDAEGGMEAVDEAVSESGEDSADAEDETIEEIKPPVSNLYRMSTSVKDFWLKLERSENNEIDESEKIEPDEVEEENHGNDEINKKIKDCNEHDVSEIEKSEDEDEKNEHFEYGNDEEEIAIDYEMDTDKEVDDVREDTGVEVESVQEVQETVDENEEINEDDDQSTVEEQIIVEESVDSDNQENEELTEKTRIEGVPHVVDYHVETDENIVENQSLEQNEDEPKEGHQELDHQAEIDQDFSEYAYTRSVNIFEHNRVKESPEDHVNNEEQIDKQNAESDDEKKDVINVANDSDQENIGIDDDNEPVLKRAIAQDASQTDDDFPEGDYFNSNYRYVVRRRSDRFSMRSNPSPIYQNQDIEEPIYEEISLRNPRRSAPVVDQERIESQYRFTFQDVLGILETLLPKNRNSIEIDGVMSVPQQVYDEQSEEEKIEETINYEMCGHKETINTRALPKEATTYELEKFEKKALVIFNQENIDGYKPRLGTKVDVEVLTRTFESYGFEVKEHPDLTRDRILEELRTFSQKDFTDYGCVAVAILTHGSDMGSLRAKDRKYYETDVINYFKSSENPTLVSKPKLIVIQACRGNKNTQAMIVGRSSTIKKDADAEYQPKTYTLPVESDFLVLHSTFAGKTSHRDEVHGSWLIQTLCQKIEELSSSHDLESIITEVKREVAIEKSVEEYNKRTKEIDINKQMPVIVSTLIRKLYLRRFGSLAPFQESIPDAPILSPVIRYAPCACFLDTFQYLKNCMRYFLEENPDDNTAIGFLNVADAIEDGVEFNAVKEQIAKAMRNHLVEKAKDYDYFKYLYLRF